MTQLDKHKELGSTGRVCLVQKCGKAGRLKGLCRTHYHNFYINHKGKTMSEFLTYVNNRVDYQKNPCNCVIHGCTNKPLAKGLCNRHYTSFKTTYLGYSLEDFLAVKNQVLVRTLI